MSRRDMTCIICPVSCLLTIDTDPTGAILALTGNKCERGATYVRAEVLNPTRSLTALIHLEDGCQPMCPVKTSIPVPKAMVRPMARAIATLSVPAPVSVGDVVVRNILGSGADLIVTRNLPAARSQCR